MSDGGQQNTRPATAEMRSCPAFPSIPRYRRGLQDFAGRSRIQKLLRDVHGNNYRLELCPVLCVCVWCVCFLSQSRSLKGKEHRRESVPEGTWSGQSGHPRQPRVPHCSGLKSLRAFNTSGNKINFYSKCIGSTSSIVFQTPYHIPWINTS